MFCEICTFYESDSTMIEYSCGHSFHRRCIMPNTMSLISPRCRICTDGVYTESVTDEDYYCNECNSGDTANRIRARSYSSDYSEIWDEVNEYRDITATCVGFLCVIVFALILI